MKNSPSVQVEGRASVRAMPDRACVAFTISRREPKPEEAFAAVRATAARVQRVLDAFPLEHQAASRISLDQKTRFVEGEERNLGYVAMLSYSVLLADLDRVEALLTELVAAGADRLDGVTFQAASFKDLRAQARREAIGNAMHKAGACAEAAGARCGKVLRIEETGQDRPMPASYELSRGSEGGSDDGAAIDPGSIEIKAQVRATFELISD